VNEPVPRKRILIVEDDELTAFSLEKLLRLQGHDVEIVRSVGAALNALDAAEGAAAFDHVLLDLQLPDADGENVLSHTEQTKHRPWVIVIATPQSLDGHRILSLRGRCEILPKPVIMDALLAMLAESALSGVGHYADAFGLSPQERLVLDRAVAGMDDAQISAATDCSHSTVKSYWARIYSKLGVKGRDKAMAHLARWLLQHRSPASGRRLAKQLG